MFTPAMSTGVVQTMGPGGKAGLRGEQIPWNFPVNYIHLAYLLSERIHCMSNTYSRA